MKSFKSFEFHAKFADLIAYTKSESIFLELSSNSVNAFLSLTSSASNKNEEASKISPFIYQIYDESSILCIKVPNISVKERVEFILNSI